MFHSIPAGYFYGFSLIRPEFTIVLLETHGFVIAMGYNHSRRASTQYNCRREW